MKRSICVVVLLAWTATGARLWGQDPAPQPSEKEVLARALERGLARERQGVDRRYTHRLLRVVEKLDRDARPARVEKFLYQVVYIDGMRYERLLEKDGEPLGKREQEAERRKEEDFRRRLRKDGDGDSLNARVFRFNRELVDRYRFRLTGTGEVNGRQAFVVSFEPRSGKLPVRHRVDRALNNSRGRVWLDQESYDIARVEFRMFRTTRFGWGILGSISHVEGILECREGEGGNWFPSFFRIYLKGRVLFRSMHTRRTSRWSDFEPVAEAPPQSSRVISRPESLRPRSRAGR